MEQLVSNSLTRPLQNFACSRDAPRWKALYATCLICGGDVAAIDLTRARVRGPRFISGRSRRAAASPSLRAPLGSRSALFRPHPTAPSQSFAPVNDPLL